MNYNYKFITNFYESRKHKLGSSDIAACIPHPVRKNESLAGYNRTAITVFEEKTGRIKREHAGFSASVGNDLEPLILKYFIEDVHSKKTSVEFFKGYILCELEKQMKEDGIIDCKPFNNTQFIHHTESENDYAISHADTLYIPTADDKGKTKVSNINFDKSKSCIIEAKTSQFWAVKRKDDEYSGFDFKGDDWKAIPLKFFFQIQFQMALYGFDLAYLPLLSNTSEKHYWEIKGNKKYQADLMELAEYMYKCVQKDIYPKEKAMNASDIQKLYPKIKEDFRECVGKELEMAIEIGKQYERAKQQKKQWELKERDALDAMSVLLKDERELKGLVNGELQTIARWKDTGGTEKIIALSKIKKDMPEIYEYLRGKKLLEYQKTDRKPEIKLKLRE